MFDSSFNLLVAIIPFIFQLLNIFFQSGFIRRNFDDLDHLCLITSNLVLKKKM